MQVERSIDLGGRSRGVLGIVGIVVGVVVGIVLTGCGDLPSKDAALEIVRHEVKEDATCTLPISFLSGLKKQYASKALCVPREDPPAPGDAALSCLNALLASGATKNMPPGYMAEWPDELSGAGFDSVSPYDRKARHLLFKGCFEMTSELREGRFKCGQARADRIVRVTKSGTGRATVRYARAITLDPQLAKIEAACGAVSRPAEEDELELEKTADKRWVIATGDAPPATSASSSK